MLGLAEVLEAVARRGGMTLEELDAALQGRDGLEAVDACVDDGLLRPVWEDEADLQGDLYRLTARGQRLLQVSLECVPAA
ncbi:MAG: hypothetical protein QOI63_150 [Thermoplasmata archaeon]|nr:hypothetical protein [Thermoplasmata archaeon]